MDVVIVFLAPVLIVIGWIVGYQVQKYFHNKNNNQKLKDDIVLKYEECLELGTKFWIDESHSSTQSDQTRIIQKLNSIRKLISRVDLSGNEKSEVIRIHTEIKRLLTNTPIGLESFQNIEKPAKYDFKINQCFDQIETVKPILQK